MIFYLFIYPFLFPPLLMTVFLFTFLTLLSPSFHFNFFNFFLLFTIFNDILPRHLSFPFPPISSSSYDSLSLHFSYPLLPFFTFPVTYHLIRPSSPPLSDTLGSAPTLCCVALTQVNDPLHRCSLHPTAPPHMPFMYTH